MSSSEQHVDRYVGELEEDRRRLQGRVRLLEGLFRDTMIVNRALAARLEETVGEGAAEAAKADAQGEPSGTVRPARGREETEALTARIQELLRIRENLLVSVRASLGGLSAELDRAESRPFLPSTPPQSAPLSPPPTDAAAVLTLHPVADLPTLVEIEHALRTIPGVSSVFIRSLERGTAVLEVAGPAEVRLREHLGETMPVPFVDESGDTGGIVLLLDPEGDAP